MTQLKGRTALITGASSGLGEHFARLFAREGANVVLGARRVDRLSGLASAIVLEGAAAQVVPMDVTDEASIIAAYDAAEAKFGIVDTIVANAGVSIPGRSTDITAADLQSLTDTNFNGVFLTAREGARRLIAAGSKANGRGRIILIGSITAHMTAEGVAAYSAAKAGVAHLGRVLAREWVRQGINVNVVQPGYIQTELIDGYFESELGKAKIADFPRRRLQPISSLDQITLYFASDASACTTGAVIDVDDGQSL